MKKVIAQLSLFTITALAISLTSCTSYVDSYPCADGVGERVTEIRELSAFNRIVVNLPADVYLHQDENARVEITAQENIIETISNEVTDETLSLKNSSCLNTYKTIRVDVYTNQLSMLEVQGSGDVYSDDVFRAEEQLTLNIESSGSMEIQAEAPRIDIGIMGSGDVVLDGSSREVNTFIYGSGDLTMRGNTDMHTLKVEGSGNARAFELETMETHIDITGSGDCEVFAQDKLDVLIQGSGNVYYKGTPVLEVTITGTGEVSYVE